MKIREICNRHSVSTAEAKALSCLGIEALPEWLVENLFGEFGKQLVIASSSLLDDEHELGDELERRRKQRRRQRSHAAGPGGIGSPPQNDAVAAPAADAGSSDAAGPVAAAPIATGGRTLG